MPSLPDGFVYLSDVCPTIVEALRYAGPENMLGRPLAGYLGNRVICTEVCATRLASAQKHFQSKGYTLVVYDAYRPRKAVEDLFAWSQRADENEMAPKYYPQFAGDKKRQLFELGYISKSSNHARGSTVDVTLCEESKRHTIVWNALLPLQMRPLSSGHVVPYLEDGTLDMGSSFDLLGEASHPTNNAIIPQGPFTEHRDLLRNAMEAEGFVISKVEWWHFWLQSDEPFQRDESNPEFGFDFDIE